MPLNSLGNATHTASIPSARAIPPIAAVFVGALLMIVLVPRTLITVAWGALFGAVGGAGYILAGALIAALLAGVVLRARNRHYRRLCAEEAVDADADGVPDVYRRGDDLRT